MDEYTGSATYDSLLQGCLDNKSLPEGKLVHAHIIQTGFKFQSNSLENKLVSTYAKCGSLVDARRAFNQMPKRNIVSWTLMIAAYARQGHGQEALTLFYEMQRTGIRPDRIAYASVLSACANLAFLEQGKEIHEAIITSGLQCDVLVGNALVDMYAKCGCLEVARHEFDKMPQRDVVSWNAMIVGYAMHGCCKEALQLFEQMQHTGTNPNHATFVGVLSACCHGGLLDEGWQYFNSMSQYYQIAPTMAHYGCMVDLLGRDGRLDEARDFINRMPIKPDAIVWGSLLGACRVHTNIALGEYVAECLIELNPKDPAPYVLLANIYAAAGKWDDIEKMRKMMQDRKVKKKHGCSWIVVNKQVYAFTIGDISHLKMHKIYAKVGPLPTET